MAWRFLASIAVVLALVGASAVGAVEPTTAMSSLIAASVAARLREPVPVNVELLQVPAGTTEPVAAVPLPGARFGAPARFLLTLADGRRTTITARVSADAGHVVASRNVPRETDLTPDDVEWVEGSLDGQPLEAPTAMPDVIGGRARRDIARGEVVTAALVRTPDAVRAGDPVTMVIRRGQFEVRGAGRAVSRGGVGDTIRVLRPGSRETLRARITEPGVVEILK